MLTQDGDDDIVAFTQKVPVNEVIVVLLMEDLPDAVLADFIDGEVPDLIN